MFTKQHFKHSVQFSSVQWLSHIQLLETPRITACQASLSITNSRSLLKLMSIKSVMASSHLILCRPLLLLPPIPPSIRVFSNESTLCMRQPKYWSFSFKIRPSLKHLILYLLHYFEGEYLLFVFKCAYVLLEINIIFLQSCASLV